ncbi:hypothetical protein Sgou_02600 [Streptomyces gougerotii]|uniref:Uncharacterized protein n=1 Tax=Streptomyces gougerotii TaxID=53448 RepID=A0ABQ1CZL8_9ACTN|nr:hypothetical protein Sgou_02600 [Streptomyces gougerotii]
MVGVGGHRGDHQEAPYRGAFGGCGEEFRAVAVHRLLAGRSAARARAGREDRRVGAPQHLGDLLHARRLQVAQDGLGARLAQVVGLGGIADQSCHVVSARGEQPLPAAARSFRVHQR